MTRLQQLDRQIARLRRRGDFLNAISRKYWNARRIIFIAGALLALAFCVGLVAVSPEYSLWGLVIALAGIPLYYIAARSKS